MLVKKYKICKYQGIMLKKKNPNIWNSCHKFQERNMPKKLHLYGSSSTDIHKHDLSTTTFPQRKYKKLNKFFHNLAKIVEQILSK